ncbi:hypothetical protein RHMOL_Rhmol06G0176300 [Rhododendron molle]|uniref:Uncharacterized protein n=1 Tax=Rhododendron molle TaxID=49168 RepID=A0ACC0NEZ9_RHOML|nr:hypothetical protein RHMOL_Rhmol06G0176300 [Rhododendron molle]
MDLVERWGMFKVITTRLLLICCRQAFSFPFPWMGQCLFPLPVSQCSWALRFEFFTTPKNVDWTRFAKTAV